MESCIFWKKIQVKQQGLSLQPEVKHEAAEPDRLCDTLQPFEVISDRTSGSVDRLGLCECIKLVLGKRNKEKYFRIYLLQ